MRHNIRPFVTVHKNRWSKSRKSSLWDANLLAEADAKPSPANASAVPTLQEPYPAEPAPSAAPTGRILPCLLQSEGQIASPEEPVRRARATNKRKAVDAKSPQPDAKAVSVERPVAETEAIHFTSEGDSGTLRRGSRIQDRWVRKTEIRPGERWKRRLCNAAK